MGGNDDDADKRKEGRRLIDIFVTGEYKDVFLKITEYYHSD